MGKTNWYKPAVVAVFPKLHDEIQKAAKKKKKSPN